MKPKQCKKLWPFTGPIPGGQRRRCTLELGHTGMHTIIPPSGMDYAPDDEPGIEPPNVLYDWTDALGDQWRLIDGPRRAASAIEVSEARRALVELADLCNLRVELSNLPQSDLRDFIIRQIEIADASPLGIVPISPLTAVVPR